jgi:hypothetical protein
MVYRSFQLTNGDVACGFKTKSLGAIGAALGAEAEELRTKPLAGKS